METNAAVSRILPVVTLVTVAPTRDIEATSAMEPLVAIVPVGPIATSKWD